MQNYKVIRKVGSGSFGTVQLAVDTRTKQPCAIKRLKKQYKSLQECKDDREVRLLSRISHPNVVKLLDVLQQDGIYYLVFQYIEKNCYEVLQDLISTGKKMTEREVIAIAAQTLVALQFLHRNRLVHRDIKPQNLSLSKQKQLKVIDFGISREYVSTRWYRAPQLVLRLKTYNEKVDIWALGCVICQLITTAPIFKGSSEADQLNKIVRIIGADKFKMWPQGKRQLSILGIQLPEEKSLGIRQCLNSVSSQTLALVQRCLVVDPAIRATAKQLLTLPIFKEHICKQIKCQFKEQLEKPKFFIPTKKLQQQGADQLSFLDELSKEEKPKKFVSIRKR